jgi:menaquinone-9 beta-reductase
MIKTDVCIVGAGPAGSMAALFLDKEGVNCVLADKATFPRDKICGDGISGWVLSVMADLRPELITRLSQQDFLLHSHGMRIIAPNHQQLDLPFTAFNKKVPGLPPGFICRRLDFDNFLIGEIKTRPYIHLLENHEIIRYHSNPEGVELQTACGKTISARLVIFANGANSAFSHQPGGRIKTNTNTILGLRAYYKGVSGCHPRNYVELHYLKELLPGYLWIFPLPGGAANVGLGLDRRSIEKKKINLKRLLINTLENTPYLKERFQHAERTSNYEAYTLPAWEKKHAISGERFMLAGDAAGLIDPLTGEGIGHAALSGKLAALQALKCLESNNFGKDFMQQYDQALLGKIGRELGISKKILRLIRHAWLFNLVANRAAKSKTLKHQLQTAMTSLDARDQFNNPLFYLRVLMGK